MSDYYKNNQEHIIGTWKVKAMRNSINNKFNQNGFIILKKDKKEKYYKNICFGKQINFEFWISEFKKGNIYYDGYSHINGRWRGTFRAKYNWWNALIIDEY